MSLERAAPVVPRRKHVQLVDERIDMQSFAIPPRVEESGREESRLS